MYNLSERHVSYKRATIYFTVYSAYFFVTGNAEFLSFKTILYFLIGWALSGAVASIVMILQNKIELKLNPNYHILNIIIEILVYYFYVKYFFGLFF